MERSRESGWRRMSGRYCWMSRCWLRRAVSSGLSMSLRLFLTRDGQVEREKSASLSWMESPKEMICEEEGRERTTRWKACRFHSTGDRTVHVSKDDRALITGILN